MRFPGLLNRKKYAVQGLTWWSQAVVLADSESSSALECRSWASAKSMPQPKGATGHSRYTCPA